MDDVADEIIVKIFTELNANNLLKSSLVCWRWYHISKSQPLWYSLVISQWPSQNWLYKNIDIYSLNWIKIYQELKLYSWFSPDHMKYFVSCCRIENEPILPCLRKSIFEKIKKISQKWIPATALDHNNTLFDRYFDENMQLYFDTKALDWVFLDKRRGYMSDLFSFKNKNKSPVKSSSQYVRPYQVIPSCLLMYRWLSIFRLYASPEQLTFYRIWRFQLKHAETGLLFDLYDWKAAMATSFTNGKPKIKLFCDDALELLHLLTHPHFIMHPSGDNNFHKPVEALYNIVHATAGGHTKQFFTEEKKVKSRKRKIPTSPSFSVNTIFSKNSVDILHQDLNDRIKNWREKRRISLAGPSNSSDPIWQGDGCPVDMNDNTTSEDVSSENESEMDFFENGYVTNCQYFISNVHEGFDSIEDQHSIQASISDNWLYAPSNKCKQASMVLYNVDNDMWYFTEHTYSESQTVNKTGEHLEKVDSIRPIDGSVVEGVVEPISSSLALYRLICLFDLNSSMYISTSFNSVWNLRVQHKRSGGIINFKDYNGFFQVNVSMDTASQTDVEAQFSYDVNEFHASVTQLLNLLMHESFCHPYGSVAGAVA